MAKPDKVGYWYSSLYVYVQSIRFEYMNPSLLSCSMKGITSHWRRFIYLLIRLSKNEVIFVVCMFIEEGKVQMILCFEVVLVTGKPIYYSTIIRWIGFLLEEEQRQFLRSLFQKDEMFYSHWLQLIYFVL